LQDDRDRANRDKKEKPHIDPQGCQFPSRQKKAIEQAQLDGNMYREQ